MDFISIVIILFAALFLLVGGIYFLDKDFYKNLMQEIIENDDLCRLFGLLELACGTIIIANSFEGGLQSIIATILGIGITIEGIALLAFREDVIAIAHKLINHRRLLLLGNLALVLLSIAFFVVVVWF